MFVSDVLKKCANLISHNENTKEDVLPEKKEEILQKEEMVTEDIAAMIDTENLNPVVTNSNRNSLFKLFDPLNSPSFTTRLQKEDLLGDTVIFEDLTSANKLLQDEHIENENQLDVINRNNKLIDIASPERSNEQFLIDNHIDECIIDVSNNTEPLDFNVEEIHIEEPCLEDLSANENIKELAEELLNSIIEKALIIVENQDSTQTKPVTTKKAMADINDKLEEENAELKLQLNASQQVRATLELQLRQKEEIIIKSQAESSRKDQTYKQEIKQLKEKLEEKCLENDNSQTKDLQETVKTLKAREAKLLSELNAKKNDEQNYRKLMDEYEKTMAAKLSELQKFQDEHETVKQHLANLELAFSDVHQKYERSKKIIDGYKCNEDALRRTLMSSEESVIKSEEKYESLKAHAKAQIEKSNQEMQLMREQYESEIHKLSAIIRRLEIKNASLADSLDQKTKECSALAALCDEVIEMNPSPKKPSILKY